jgi:hypothetical protein
MKKRFFIGLFLLLLVGTTFYLSTVQNKTISPPAVATTAAPIQEKPAPVADVDRRAANSAPVSKPTNINDSPVPIMLTPPPPSDQNIAEDDGLENKDESGNMWAGMITQFDLVIDSKPADVERMARLKDEFTQKFANFDGVGIPLVKCSIELCRIEMSVPNDDQTIQKIFGDLHSIKSLDGMVFGRVDIDAEPALATIYVSEKDSPLPEY